MSLIEKQWVKCIALKDEYERKEKKHLKRALKIREEFEMFCLLNIEVTYEEVN